MADLTITRNTTLPNSSSKSDFHNLVDTATGSITNIVNADINSSAAIASSKLDLSSVGQKIVMSSKAIDQAQGSNIASASSIDLGAATGNYVVVTGTTGITSLGTVQAGVQRIVEFSGALTLTHNATSLILPGGANITTAAGDVAQFVSEGSGNWRCTSYVKASGESLIGAGGVLGSYKNLKVVRDSATQVTVTADELILETSGNSKVTTRSVSEAIAITTSGASGLDTGVEGSSRWYYIWIIRKSSDGTVNGLLSESSSAPTMPSGYDQKALVSAVYNNASSNFVDFVDEGFSYVYKEDRQLFSGAYSNNSPVSYLGSGTGDSGTYAYGKYSINVTAQHSWMLPITTANTIYYCSSGSSWTSIDLTGFVPSVLSTFCYGSAQNSGGTGTIAIYGFFKNKLV